MDNSKIELELSIRIREQLRCEVVSDVDGWLAIVDPELRDSATEHKADLAQTLAHIQSAELVAFTVEEYNTNLRNNRPGAKVDAGVRYNESTKVMMISPLWILDDGEWYTRATGKTFGW